VNIAAQAIQLRDDQPCSGLLAEVDGLGEFRTSIILARFVFLELSDKLPVTTVEEADYSSLLSVDPKALP
jgi:hypothetical protein